MLLLRHYDAFRGRKTNNFSILKTNNDEIPQPRDARAPLKGEELAKVADMRPIEKQKEGGNMTMSTGINEGHRDMKCKVEDKAVEEERMDRIDEYGGLYPSSPSFRIYCIRCDDDADDVDDDGKTEVSETESLHDDSSSKASDVSKDSIVSIQGLTVGKTEKRHKKGRMLRCMMPKGGPISMKNFLKMQSCYYPCSCNDRTHLLPQKPVA